MVNYKDIFNSYSYGDYNFLFLNRSVTFPDDRSLDIYARAYIAEDTPWTVLSYKLYGTIDYWWVLAGLNRGNPFHAEQGTQCDYIRKENLQDIFNLIQKG